MQEILRRAALVAIAKPFARWIIGMSVAGQSGLPDCGPAIIVANHNSHIDTLLIMCLFPSRMLRKLRPVAAADRFLRSPISSWLSRRVVGILPITRGRPTRSTLIEAESALRRGEILLIFPEGTRGETEAMNPLKAGICRLARAFPDAPIVPILLQGTRRVLPPHSWKLVPSHCRIAIGRPLVWCGNRIEFMSKLKSAFEALITELPARRPPER